MTYTIEEIIFLLAFSGTGPDVRFYIFGKRESHLEEIKSVQMYVKENYV